jgi:multiple sugar transport system permease protein
MKERRAQYYLPTLILIFFLTGYPIAYVMVLTFFKLDILTLEYKFVGLNNLYSIITSPETYITLENTIIWTIVTTLGSLLLGLSCALMLNREKIRFKSVFSCLLFIPYAIGYVEAGYLWLTFTNPIYGIFNHILKGLGIISTTNISFFTNRWTALGIVMLAQIWKHFPFMMIMLLAGLQSIRKELYEAAKVDGAGTLTAFFNITLPQLKPALFLSLLLMLIWNFNSFTLVWVITRGGPYGMTHIFSTKIYELAFTSFNFGAAAAFSEFVFLVVFIISMVYLRIAKIEV